MKTIVVKIPPGILYPLDERSSVIMTPEFITVSDSTGYKYKIIIEPDNVTGTCETCCYERIMKDSILRFCECMEIYIHEKGFFCGNWKVNKCQL